jgi:hypothetical protein
MQAIGDSLSAIWAAASAAPWLIAAAALAGLWWAWRRRG